MDVDLLNRIGGILALGVVTLMAVITLTPGGRHR